jgi:tRNA (cmo5U34)-methyltransferase
MNERQSKWRTEELATTYLQGVRGAIPAASLQLEALSKIIRSWRPQPEQILDLGCGDGAVGRFLFDQFPAAHVVFADFSVPMLDAARTQLGASERATILKADFSSRTWLDELGGRGPFDVVVSGFAIHHQPNDRKKSLYAEVFGLLNTGGVFLNLEHVASPTAPVAGLFDDYFLDHLFRFHHSTDPTKSREQVAQAYYSRPDKDENILAPVEDQCEWLRRIGFTDVDCFFKIFELALFGGRKTSNNAVDTYGDP